MPYYPYPYIIWNGSGGTNTTGDIIWTQTDNPHNSHVDPRPNFGEKPKEKDGKQQQ